MPRRTEPTKQALIDLITEYVESSTRPEPIRVGAIPSLAEFLVERGVTAPVTVEDQPLITGYPGKGFAFEARQQALAEAAQPPLVTSPYRQPRTPHQHDSWMIRISDADGSRYCAACGDTVEPDPKGRYVIANTATNGVYPLRWMKEYNSYGHGFKRGVVPLTEEEAGLIFNQFVGERTEAVGPWWQVWLIEDGEVQMYAASYHFTEGN